MKALARLRRRREKAQKRSERSVDAPTSSQSSTSTSAPITTPSPSSALPVIHNPSSTSQQRSTETDDSSPPTATASSGTQHIASAVDSRGQITFNLQLLTDQGIVICPGFHRKHQPFTSTALLAAVRPTSPTNTASTTALPRDSVALPVIRATADVETSYSPTLLPPPPSSHRSEDGTSSTASTASSTTPLDELTIAYAKGAFSLIDTAAATAAVSATTASASKDNGSSSATTNSTAAAAATAALRRLASWRSANNATAVTTSSSSGSESESTTAFPPTSALPATAQVEDDTGSSVEEEEDAIAGLHSSSAQQMSEQHSVAHPITADTALTSSTTRIEQVSTEAEVASSLPHTPVQTAVNPPTVAVSTADPATSRAVPTTSSTLPSTTSPSSSLLSLPAALLSTVSSWLFPAPLPSNQPTDPALPAADATPTPPTIPPPPPPPPPYATTLRRVVIIGVHGWSLFGGMIGDKPLLVSSRFCYYIHHALTRYMRTLSASLPDGAGLPPLHITCIPLYGHGRVEERVSMYIESQLPQYADELRQADHIIVACHSQGCMVTSSLLALLLLNTNPPVSLPAPPHISVVMLAGLHHGPFPDLPTDLYPPTSELLSYAHFHSNHSQRHIEHMHRLMNAGVRVMLVGSVHDAVVPLYSSLGQLLGRSPNLVRAMYVDYQHYQPDFLYSFLSLALYLANRPAAPHSAQRGMSVGGGGGANEVLTHISGFLRGSLLEKAGGAHSAMHRLVDVYGLAVEWAMGGTGEVSDGVSSVSQHSGVGGYSGVMWSAHLTDGFTSGKLNRHLLVWSVRSMLAELDVRRGESGFGLDVDEEKQRLCVLFLEWTPKTKQLRVLRETLSIVFDTQRSANASTIQSNL